MGDAFWESKPLQQMSDAEWESLCDGCGKCCLNKLEDEDTGELHFTDVACRLLNLETCRCSDYGNRQSQVPDCVQLTADHLDQYHWLPDTCAYRLLSQGQPLPTWHPLLSGDQASVHRAGISAKGRAISEQFVAEDQLEEHIVHWVT